MSPADGTILGTTQIFGTAPRRTAFNVILLAEGFTNREQNAFDTAAQAFAEILTSTTPITDYLEHINVFGVNVASTESGADDPLAAGGTGDMVRTYFDATFGHLGIRRFLVCNQEIALAAAAEQVPEFTVVLVVVNSTIYGGSGGGVGTYSLHPSATEIALHELGHTAFHLADEYEYLRGCGIDTDRNTHPGPEPPEPNVTINSNLGTLKWRRLVASGTPIPTTRNADCMQCDPQPSPVPPGTIGLFEGADTYHCGAFRPEFNCRMRSLGAPFCQVCAAAIPRRIDRVPPVISEIIAESSSGNRAIVRWRTSELADSQVEYGPTASLGFETPLDQSLRTLHAVLLTSLIPDTRYRFVIKTRDRVGNLATDTGGFYNPPKPE